MNLSQNLRQAWLTTIKYTLNPLTRRMARAGIGPFAIVQHVGRRSGKQYETPIIARPISDGFVIELTYGPDVDWHKNVLAAGGCTILWHRRMYPINRIEQLDSATGRAAFSPLQQMVLRLLGRTHFEQLTFHR